jgi:hypothetical protein
MTHNRIPFFGLLIELHREHFSAARSKSERSKYLDDGKVLAESVNPGAAATFTATVKYSTTGTPTGTVNFHGWHHEVRIAHTQWRHCGILHFEVSDRNA